MPTFNDGSIVASPVGLTFPQYLTNDVADSYFYARLNSDVWLNACERDKTAALIQSTRAIDNLNFLGVKFDMNQPLQFPRWQPDALASSGFPPYWNGGFYFENPPPYSPIVLPTIIPGIPPEILMACCENAIVLLDDFDFEVELASLNVSTSQYATIRDTYDRTLAVTHLRHGIASSQAWIMLKPWLADTNTFTLSRVN